MNRDHSDYRIVEIGPNTEKSPVGLRKLAVYSDSCESSSANAGIKFIEETSVIDPNTRKRMILYEALHPRDDTYRLYGSRKEGGKGLTSAEDSVDTSIQRLEDYIKKSKERLTKATKT